LKKKVIPDDILSQLDDFDFHFVSLTCVFRPDPGCRINWARFEVELSATSKSGELLEKPIAWYIFPKKISSKTKYKREVSLTFGIGFTLIPIQIGPKLDVRRDEKFVVYEPAIFSSGLRSSSASWDFKSTRSEEISGDQSDLLLIVRTAKNSKIEGRFLLSAKGECNIIKWFPIPFHKKEDPVYYPLSK